MATAHQPNMHASGRCRRPAQTPLPCDCPPRRCNPRARRKPSQARRRNICPRTDRAASTGLIPAERSPRDTIPVHHAPRRRPPAQALRPHLHRTQPRGNGRTQACRRSCPCATRAYRGDPSRRSAPLVRLPTLCSDPHAARLGPPARAAGTRASDSRHRAAYRTGSGAREPVGSARAHSPRSGFPPSAALDPPLSLWPTTPAPSSRTLSSEPGRLRGSSKDAGRSVHIHVSTRSVRLRFLWLRNKRENANETRLRYTLVAFLPNLESRLFIAQRIECTHGKEPQWVLHARWREERRRK